MSHIRRLCCLGLVAAAFTHVLADERRAPAPKFDNSDLDSIFFGDIEDAFRGPRPTLSALRKSAAVAAIAQATPKDAGGADTGKDTWSPLISPASIEDEVKRVKLHFDSVVTTPGAFNGGGYMDARLDLTVLAMMFAVVHEHSGDVRWKDQAPAARDLLARTAFNCKAGSTQVYNEAKLRKGDLQDLVSGSGLTAREAEPENDWAMIVDRSPLMEYADQLIDSLEDSSRDEKSVNADTDKIRREAELLSVFGEVLTKEGLDEAEDEDYVQLSRDMMDASKGVVAALERGNAADVRKNVSAIRQRCDACHEQYR